MPRASARSRANCFVARYGVDGESFVPVGPRCDLLRIARTFQLNTLNVALAASFFQRLASVDMPHDDKANVISGMDRFLRSRPGHRAQPLVFECTVDQDSERDWPGIVLACCLHLAVKLTHVPRNWPAEFGPRYSLRTMMCAMYGSSPSRSELRYIEAWILKGLRFRLVDRSKLLDHAASPGSHGSPASSPASSHGSPASSPRSLYGGARSPASVLGTMGTLHCSETLSLSPCSVNFL